MLTIILLAFSLIGIIGLTVGNRFILIIFAACMTLILIASITIYAIERTEQDASKPKVPYYTSLPAAQSDLTAAHADRGTRMRSFVSKLLNRNQQTPTPTTDSITGRNSKRQRKYPSSRLDPEIVNGTRGSSRNQLRRLPSQSVPAPQAVDDYSDESNGLVHMLLSSPPETLPFARSGLVVDDKQKLVAEATATATKLAEQPTRKSQQEEYKDQDLMDESNMVESQQWIAYERRLYERYLDIVSQSIDLVLLSILASWMALLLDEESDQCFGNARGSSKQARSGGAGRASKHEAPIYNYNGVRYSIKPDETAADSTPSRVIVR